MFSIKACNIYEKLRGSVRVKDVLFNYEIVGYYSGSIRGNKPYGWGELYILNNAYCSQTRLVGEFLSGLAFKGKIFIHKSKKPSSELALAKSVEDSKFLKLQNWTTLIYEGDFFEFNKDGEPSGVGKLNFIKRNSTESFKYIGEIIEGTMHGKGKLERKDGTTFDGIWEEGVRGSGIIRFKNGDIYHGDWKYGVFHGSGSFTTKNEKFIGTWSEGCFLSGEKTDIYGVIYKGTWDQQGNINKGKIIWPNGDVYQGKIKKLQMHGQGILKQANGVVLEGIWYEGGYVKGSKIESEGSVNEGVWIRKIHSEKRSPMTNFIAIDLVKLFKTKDELYSVSNFYKSIGVPIPTSKEAVPFLLDQTYEGVLRYMKFHKGVSKIWINPDNGFVIAYEDKEGYSFSQNFNDHLVNIESLEISEEQLSFPTVDMDIDSILDKISKYGIDSLTEHEKMFLEQSK